MIEKIVPVLLARINFRPHVNYNAKNLTVNV